MSVNTKSKRSADPAKGGTRWSTIPQRRKIMRLFREGKRVKEIVELTGESKWVIYKVLSGKSKTDYKPRSDKGVKRKKSEVERSEIPPEAGEPVLKTRKHLTEFNDVDEFLEYEIFVACEHLANTTMQPDERIKLVAQVSKLQQQLHDRKLESHIQRADAETIAAIVRRYEPKADEDRVILVYTEASEKVQAGT